MYSNKYHELSCFRGWARHRNKIKYKDIIEKNRSKKILVILHMFYPESWKEIREYLKNLSEYDWKLIVTYPESHKNILDLASIREFKRDTDFYAFENRGYDIGPFVQVLKKIDLKKYDIVFKLQSKGVKRNKIYIYKQLFWGRSWFVNLFEGCIGAGTVHTTIDMLSKDEHCGVVCAKNLIVKDPKHKQSIVKKALIQRGLEYREDYEFVAGTCFAIRADLLEDLKKNLIFSADEFETVLPSRGMSFAHILERYLIIYIVNKGYGVYGNEVCEIYQILFRPVIFLLGKLSSERLLEEPYLIDDEFFHWRLDNKFIIYKEKEIEIGKLKWNKEKKRDFFIKDCVPYRYLMGDKAAYIDYAELHRKTGQPIMTPERFDSLIESLRTKGYDERNIIIVNERNMICDGQHRACYLAYKYGLDYKIRVLEIKYINKKSIIKGLIPKKIKQLYYTKKYGCY